MTGISQGTYEKLVAFVLGCLPRFSTDEEVRQFMTKEAQFRRACSNLALPTIISTGDDLVTHFRIWRTVKIDAAINSSARCLAAAKKSGVAIRPNLRKFVDDSFFQCTFTDPRFDLVKISPRYLGFNQVTALKVIFDRAQSVGLSLCATRIPFDLAIQLGENHGFEGAIHVAIHSFPGFDGKQKIIDVISDGSGASLSTSDGFDDVLYAPDSLFLFSKF